MSSRPVFATWFGKVGGGSVGGQYHVAGIETDACVGMGGHIVKELVTCFLEGLGAMCLA